REEEVKELPRRLPEHFTQQGVMGGSLEVPVLQSGRHSCDHSPNAEMPIALGPEQYTSPDKEAENAVAAGKRGRDGGCASDREPDLLGLGSRDRIKGKQRKTQNVQVLNRSHGPHSQLPIVQLEQQERDREEPEKSLQQASLAK